MGAYTPQQTWRRDEQTRFRSVEIGIYELAKAFPHFEVYSISRSTPFRGLLHFEVYSVNAAYVGFCGRIRNSNGRLDPRLCQPPNLEKEIPLASP